MIKKSFLILPALLLCLGMAGCDSNYPSADIPVEDFDISHCWWSINPESPNGQIQEKVYILNSEEVLSNYYACFDIAIDGQRIDFDKYSLIALWSSGAKNDSNASPTNHVGEATSRYVKQVDKNAYEWSIDVNLNTSPLKENEYWFRSAIISKVPEHSKFKLIINYH
jgi:hypothetical protein